MGIFALGARPAASQLPPPTSRLPMDESRRDFLIKTGAAAAALGVAGLARPAAAAQRLAVAATPGDPTIRELAFAGIDAAKSAGAQYADVRIAENRNQRIFTREDRVQGLNDS